jgi:uncharacterized membrane protein
VGFANPLPWWALAAVIGAAAALAWLAYGTARLSPARRAALGALRFVTLVLLVVLLMRPVARSREADATGAIVPILVDTSRSMAIEDAGGMRRIDRARDIVAAQLLPALSGQFHTEVLGFGAALAPASASADSLTASAARSDLAAALAELSERYRGRRVAGIIVLSDGGVTSSPNAAADVPPAASIFALGVGTATVGRDREVLSVTAAEAVLDRSRVDLAVSAVSHGQGTAPIELRLLENGRPLEVRRATPAAEGTPVRETFHVSPAAGAPSVYSVEIPAAAGELVPENNTRSVLVQPPGRPRRVLLVQGAPGFEHSFLQRAWSADTGLEIDSVVRKGRNEQGGDTFYVQAGSTRAPSLASGYPATRAELFAYDAVVLANVAGASLSAAQLEATRDFVGRRGGGLLVMGAQSFLRQGLLETPLEDVLPLDLADRGRGVLQASVTPPRGANRVALTSAGEAHPIMQLTGDAEETRKRWEAVPALASISPLGGPRPGASVLAVTSGPGGVPRALVAVQRYGTGRAMMFTGEAAWRWRMMLPADDRSYETFWCQSARWLALPATDPVTLVPPESASPGEDIRWRVFARDAEFAPLAGAAVTVRVTAPDGLVQSITASADPGVRDGSFVAHQRPAAAGIYRATAEVRQPDKPPAVATASLLVGGADPEMADPRLNLRVLQRIAAASGGRVIETGEIAALPAQLRAAVPAAIVTARRDLWHNAWSFAALVLLLAGEWLLRRRWGMR